MLSKILEKRRKDLICMIFENLLQHDRKLNNRFVMSDYYENYVTNFLKILLEKRMLESVKRNISSNVPIITFRLPHNELWSTSYASCSGTRRNQQNRSREQFRPMSDLRVVLIVLKIENEGLKKFLENVFLVCLERFLTWNGTSSFVLFQFLFESDFEGFLTFFESFLLLQFVLHHSLSVLLGQFSWKLKVEVKI